MPNGETIWKPHVTVASVIENDGKFLLVEETINGKQVLNQPAGHLEPDETLIDAVIRETMEETGWNFQPEHLINVYRLNLRVKNQTYLRFNFAGLALSFDPDRELDTGIDRTVWLSYEDISSAVSRHRSPLVMQAIRDYSAGIRYPLSLLQDIDSFSGD